MSKMPRGLPEVDPSVCLDRVSAFDRGRICTTCKTGESVRIVSNASGVHAFCRKCKRHWPLSSTPLGPQLPPELGRGIHKQTLVEPNWDKAFDENLGDATNGQVGPRKK
jgi:hypothetical protein